MPVFFVIVIVAILVTGVVVAIGLLKHGNKKK